MKVVVAGVGDEGEVALAQRQPRAWIDERHGSKREGLHESGVRHRLTRERLQMITIGYASVAPNVQCERDGDRNAAGHSHVDSEHFGRIVVFVYDGRVDGAIVNMSRFPKKSGVRQSAADSASDEQLTDSERGHVVFMGRKCGREFVNVRVRKPAVEKDVGLYDDRFAKVFRVVPPEGEGVGKRSRGLCLHSSLCRIGGTSRRCESFYTERSDPGMHSRRRVSGGPSNSRLLVVEEERHAARLTAGGIGDGILYVDVNFVECGPIDFADFAGSAIGGSREIGDRRRRRAAHSEQGKGYKQDRPKQGYGRTELRDRSVGRRALMTSR